MIDFNAIPEDLETPGMNGSQPPIELNPEEEDQPGVINLNADGGTPAPSEAIANRRTDKIVDAFDDQKLDKDGTRREILSGNEGQLRTRLARQRDIDFHNRKLEVIRKLAEDRAKEGKSLSKDESDFIIGLSQEDFQHDPATIMETEYAKKFFTRLVERQETVLRRHLEQNPKEATVDLDIASNVKARLEIAKTIHDDLEDRKSKLGWFDTATTYTSQFLISPLENYRLRNVADKTAVSFLPGSNLAEQADYLWTLPPSEFQKALKAASNELASKNVLTAQKFVEAVLQYGSSDRNLDNVFGLMGGFDLPLLTAGKLVTSVARGVRAGAARSATKRAAGEVAEDAKKALKDAVKAEAGLDDAPEEVAAATGDVTKSAVLTAYKDAQARFAGKDPLSESKRMIQAIPGLFNIQRILKGVEYLGREAAERISDRFYENAASLLDSASDVSNVNRLSGQALEEGFKKTQKDLESWYPHLNDAVIDTHWVKAEETAANVNEVEVRVGKQSRPIQFTETEVRISLGKPDALLFGSREEAFVWGDRIYKLNPQEYTIQQQGTGYYISIRKSVDETRGEVRDQLLVETGHQTPQTVMNTFIGRLRTPEDLLSETNRTARHAATHGAQELHRYALDVAGDIGALSNKSKKKLLTVLQNNRDTPYPDGKVMRKGVFYNDVAELEKGWTSIHGKPPTEKEVAAYFAAIQLNSWEWMFRNLGLYRDKARMGIERFRWEYQRMNDETGNAEMFNSEFIEGRLADNIQWDDPAHAGIWVYDKESNTGKWFDKSKVTGEERTDIQKKLEQDGYRLIQIANPLHKPLRKIANNDEVINFVVVPAAERAPLDWNQLPYRPGGHIEFMHDHWVKQASVRQSGDNHHYEGDIAMSNHATEAEAIQFAKDMDRARLLLKEGKEAELADHVKRTLPFTVAKWKSFFQEGKDEFGNVIPPRFSLNSPFRHTASGRTVVDSHKDVANLFPNFRDEIRSTYNLYGQIDKKYANEREAVVLDTIKAQLEGPDMPAFRIEPAKLVDPFTAMNRGLANIMRSRHFADYKWMSVEHFIQEFHDVLKVEGGLEALRKDPVHFLHNPVWDELHPDKGKLQAAKNARRAVLELLGTESEVQSSVRWLQEKVLNGIYNRFGQKAADWTAEHLLPFEKDPVKWMRSVGFHSKLGLFNPVQLFLQAQTLTHIAAVSGMKNAAVGLTAATLMRRLALTREEGIINAVAEMAAKAGWKKEDFLESYEHLRKSGLWNVEGEVAFKDDYFDPKLFMGRAGKFLDKGTFFFREGERLVRLASWNVAYREWKLANPGKALDSEARNSILLRQNTLNVNMTRASNAWWQQGIMSVPTQFFSYQVRLMEQFFGKRLTTSEKAHAFAVYSAMYGVPAAVGATAGLWPWYEDIRQAALERDIDVNSPGIKAFMEGIPSLVWSVVTGDDRNWSQQFGPRGLSFFKDLFVKDKTDVLFGASANIIGDMIKSVDPIARAMVSVFKPESERFEFIAEDFVNALSNVSTINNVGRGIFALNTHRFLSKNEVYLGDATTMDGIMKALTGTDPMIISDAFIKSFSLQQQRKMQAEVEKEIIKNFRRGLRYGFDGDESGMQRAMRNARLLMIGGNFRPDQQVRIFREALKGHESLVDKIQRQWMSDPARFNRMFGLPEEK
jgi:hypothetical protein